MATALSDLTSLVTSLLRGTAPTNQQLLNIGTSYLYYMTDADVANLLNNQGLTKATLTNEQIANIVLIIMRTNLKSYCVQAGRDAANAANAAAAQSAGDSNATGF
jgi:Ni,Fe-hydrogenase I small subunit